jgi:hypothetical protein
MSEQAFTITIKPAEASQLEMLDPLKTRWYGSLLPSVKPERTRLSLFRVASTKERPRGSAALFLLRC